jgi:hypothetical protein
MTLRGMRLRAARREGDFDEVTPRRRRRPALQSPLMRLDMSCYHPGGPGGKTSPGASAFFSFILPYARSEKSRPQPNGACMINGNASLTYSRLHPNTTDADLGSNKSSYFCRIFGGSNYRERSGAMVSHPRESVPPIIKANVTPLFPGQRRHGDRLT